MKNEHFTIDEMYKTYKEFYDLFKMELDNIKVVYTEHGGTVRDFGWHIFNRLLVALAKNFQDGIIPDTFYYERLREVYFQMTLFQRRHEGKKGNHTYNQFLLNDLLWNKAKTPQYKLNAIVISNKCCEYCDSVDNIKSSLDEAIVKPIIDATKCKHHYGCRACFGYEIVR